jgi:hypothetical protein
MGGTLTVWVPVRVPLNSVFGSSDGLSLLFVRIIF